MKNEENGYSARLVRDPHFQPREYYLPASRARNIAYYRQRDHDGDETLGVEALDYSILSVLHLTGLSFPELTLESVEVDAGVPLLMTVQSGAKLFAKARFPLNLAYGASLCLLLNAPALSGKRAGHCYARKPEKVTVRTSSGIFVFEAKALDCGKI
jgi:hypothetical protein